MQQNEVRIVIVGGGFAGIRTALLLEKERFSNTKILLISDKPHFEYHPALYRVVAGSSPLEVCVPLREIFFKKNVEIIQDSIETVDRGKRTISGASGSHYRFDYLILALGSETNYFGIPGLKEFSYGMKSMSETLRLRRHITETLALCQRDPANKAEQICSASFVVIGAGATGVEMAGRLISYARDIAREQKLDPSLVSVELIEGSPKILPALPAVFTDRIESHLRSIGVNIFLNRVVEKEEFEEVFMQDIHMKARTVIWTSGVKANSRYMAMGFNVDKRGKVEVDEYLRAKNEQNIFIAGDGAATKYSGWAQTAFFDGKHIAKTIICLLHNRPLPRYAPKPAVNIIPAGHEWAGMLWGSVRLYGKLGWWLRRIADLKVFLMILPMNKAWSVFREGESISQSCSVCAVESPHAHAKGV